MLQTISLPATLARFGTTSPDFRVTRWARNSTYTLVWAPGALTIEVNGNLYMVDRYTASNATSSHPFAPFELRARLALR